MSDQNNTESFIEDGRSLTGDALLHAVRRDLLQLFGLVKTLDQKFDALDAKVEGVDAKVEAVDAKVEAVDAKVEARLRDTTPMWEVVVSRLDNVLAEQENHGRRLNAMEGRLNAMEGRLHAMEGRLDAIEGRLDAIETKLERFDAIDSELRLLRRRIERTIGQLSKDVVEYRADQHDIEDRVEKLEKTPA